LIKKEEQSPIPIFEARKKTFLDQQTALQGKYNFLSTVRILIFIIGLTALVYLSNERNFNTVLVLIFGLPILFGFFLNYHNRIKYQLNQVAFLANINQQEIERSNLNLSSFDTGSEFADPTHPYTSDLNIFGRHSLFQLVNRTITLAGKSLLSDFLKNPLTNSDKIKERQIAIKELSKKLEWRQRFEASGRHERSGTISYQFLLKWIHEPNELKNKGLLKVIGWLLPLLLIFTIVGYFAFEFSGYFILLSLIINAAVLFSISKSVTSALNKTERTSSALKTYSSLISEIEDENFDADLLVNLKRKIVSPKKKASERIKRLSKIVGNLEMRNNPYFSSTINIAVLWDLYWMIQLEDWKKDLKYEVADWLSSVENFEVLISIAGFSFSNPEMIFPVIIDEDFHISGLIINHPLISKLKRVENGISLKGLGKTHVITGSNMSGKSTYMRTIGINAVLALVGAPVLAMSFTISPMKVFTCMHIHDSLEEETSSFYAELKRIKQLILALETNEPVLYLLDELLKGTNSVDRNLGAKALIRQLHHKSGSGLISTHDLELGDMEGELPGFVQNFSFNSSIINDEIIFDYKLKEGICHSFNASKLMEKMGIKINSVT
jgi:hypothetical protein